MPWGYAAVAGATLIGSSMTAGATSDAASAQAAASDASIAEQQRQFNITQANEAPYLANGTAANNQLAMLLGISPTSSPSSAPVTASAPPDQSEANFDSAAYLAANPQVADPNQWATSAWDHYQQYGKNQGIAFPYINPPTVAPAATTTATPAPSANPSFGSLLKPFTAADLAADPVYNSGLQFGLDQGTSAINQQALQSGSYNSGATLKALTQYANDYGSTKANDSYNRYNTTNSQIYNQLAGISGTGQTAVSQVASTGTNTANAISSDLTNQGNSTAAGIIGGSNAWGSGISSINGIYNNYNSNQQLQQLLGNSSSGTSNSLSGSYITGNDATIY